MMMTKEDKDLSEFTIEGSANQQTTTQLIKQEESSIKETVESTTEDLGKNFIMF